MKKKILSLLVAASMLTFGLTACGGTETETAADPAAEENQDASAEDTADQAEQENDDGGKDASQPDAGEHGGDGGCFHFYSPPW